MEASRTQTPVPKGAGWAAFAGVMVLMLGVFNAIWGLVALVDDDYFVAGGLLFWDLDGWGLVLLIIGGLQILAAMLIFVGNALGAFLGVLFAMLNAVGQLLAIEAYPIWSIIVLVLDALVIYALTVYGDALRAT